MTDEVDTGSPASGADTGSPNGGGSNGQQPNGQPASQPNGDTQKGAEGQQPPAFTVPEAYKEKSWASKLKSQDDVWKQLDNLDQMVGKKTITQIDYTKATPEEIEAYHATTRPADKSAYQFGEGADPEFSGAVGDVFFKAGISAHQGNIILKEIPAIASALAKAQQEKDTSADGYLKLATDSFGTEAKNKVVFADQSLKQYASKEDYAVLDGLDNATRIAVDRTILAVLAKHGVTETGAQGDGGTGKVATDKTTIRAEIRKQLTALESRPHSAQEKADLIERLNKTYTS